LQVRAELTKEASVSVLSNSLAFTVVVEGPTVYGR
jgi:hypothetical protein